MNKQRLTHSQFAAALAMAMLLLLCATRPAQSALGEPPMTVCKDQTYALCAAARCNVFDGVAYCQCDVKSGNSISLVFQMGKGDVCSVNASGPENGFMVSTFSLPASIVAPHGDHAIYSCPRGPSEGAYAQCDGGLCFASTGGKTFPGFDGPVPKGQILCSCPITTGSIPSDVIGHQILGPYPCQESFFQYCKSDTANTKTGSTIYVGAPTGTVQKLTKQLNGNVPAINECHPPSGL